MKIIPYLLFGIMHFLEVADTNETICLKSETKSVTAWHFSEVAGDKWFERKEIKTKYTLRVRKSFPKDAKKPTFEVIAYKSENEPYYYGTWQVGSSFRDGFNRSADLPFGLVYFNL